VAFGIWGYLEVDSYGLQNVDSTYQNTCGRMNSFLGSLSVCCFVESGITLVLAISIYSVADGGWWAALTVLSFSLFGLYFILKTIALMIGILWVWGENANICESVVPALYKAASHYLFGLLVVYGFQLSIGTSFLFGCGLGGAVDEGWNKCLYTSNSTVVVSDDEDDDEQRELVPSKKNRQNASSTSLGTEEEGLAETDLDQLEGETATTRSTDMNSPITVNWFGSSAR